ncbi:5979_t:CDS:2 [Funneliformis geosporum]|uniref:6_t:CDS:1 n=1 Tax=Funneliformis geosporum TaxID=1117311 RepID=A0A9W4SX30_9GLOM|nr:6_t:CDS:2 [Funneliformis geosporum]CAI2184296.1 5979_t:CDS:2 [Funneliformis geosporum]
MKWRKSILSLSSRVPLYLSISEIFQYLVFMPNFFYSLIYHELIPETPCKIFAYFFFLQININMIFMAGIAIVTYLSIVKAQTYQFGTYDWKFITCILSTSLLLSTLSIPSLGPTKFWCLASSSTNYLSLISEMVIFGVTFIIICYCYYNTLSKIFNVDRENTASTGRINRRNKLERQATLKILIYISIFLKWLPLTFFSICIMTGSEEALWMHISALVAFHLGGLFSCILYLMNEGFPYSNRNSATYEMEEQDHDLQNHPNVIVPDSSS